jgi:hypothetical protein
MMASRLKFELRNLRQPVDSNTSTSEDDFQAMKKDDSSFDP